MAELKSSVVVLGAGGLLGHVLALHLLESFPGSVFLQARRPTGIPEIDRCLRILDMHDWPGVSGWLDSLGEITVINCVVTKPQNNGVPAEDLREINSTLPHRLADHLDSLRQGSRLIQISSDGVFNARQGGYTENDLPDSTDAYGLSKIDGEITHGSHLTLRTSFIGPSLSSSPTGLMDWFLNAQEAVEGHSQSFWSGVTSLELARFIEFVIHQETTGLIHLAGERTSKESVLRDLSRVYQKKLNIFSNDDVVMDRSLRSIRKDLSYQVPRLPMMLEELKLWYGLRIKRAV
jgi:dTDP-4-dehydrorhamnose reductase